MKKILFIFLFTYAAGLAAQPVLSVPNLEDPKADLSIKEYFTIWKDTTGKMQARDVWIRERSSFIPFSDFEWDVPLDGIYWAFLKYEPDAEINPYITFNGSQAYLYLRNDIGNIVEYRGPTTERLKARRSGSFETDVPVIQLKGFPNTSQFLLFKISFKASEKMEVLNAKYSTQSFEMLDLIAGQQSAYYAFVGILIAFFLYNIFFLVVTRESSNVFFLVYVFAAILLLYQLFQTDVLFQSVEGKFVWSAVLNRFLILVLVISFGSFTTTYMNLKKEAPQIRQVILGLLGVFVLNFVFWFIEPRYEETTRNFNVLISLVLFFCAALAATRIYFKGVKHLRYVMFSFVVLFICLCLFGLDFFGAIETNFNFFFTGITAQIFLFSLSFADRFNLEKAKRLDVLSEQNVLLENRVLERTREIQEEQEKSEKLLLNILPKKTAEELKSEGKALAHLYSNCTVLFSDFVDFTKISEKLEPQKLVDLIDECFSGFDQIVDNYPIEKIKTIGDAYMCVSGLPESNSNHAQVMVSAALDMAEFLRDLRHDREAKGLPFFEGRFGLSSGSVVAGVVGTKKFQYDIWSDTVNTAARMEQNSRRGAVNISDTTYQLVKGINALEFETRGSIKVKNKGQMSMYFVTRGSQ